MASILNKKPINKTVLSRQKKQKSHAVSAIPDFLSRKTLVEHVHDNMLYAGRETYFQRLIYIYRLKEEFSIKEEKYQEIVANFNKIGQDNMLTGILLNYKKRSIHMIEGAERVVGRFVREFLKKFREFIEVTKLILVYNNTNQRFFNRCIIKIAEPLTLLELIVGSDRDTVRYHLTQFITRIYDLCGKMRNDEMEDQKSVRSRFLTGLYIKILPEVEILDFLLTLDTVQTLEEYDDTFYKLLDISNYDDFVWPHPHDHLPSRVFDWIKYDVNLTFGQKKV